MKVNYNRISSYDAFCKRIEEDVESLSGRLLELTGSYSLLITLSDEGKPVVYSINGRMVPVVDYCVDKYLEEHSCSD